MSFRVSARTILQLGAELISSDGIAFYELLKNGIDAGSAAVHVKVVVRAAHHVCELSVRALDGDPDAQTALASFQPQPRAAAAPSVRDRPGLGDGPGDPELWTDDHLLTRVRAAIESTFVERAPDLDALRLGLRDANTRAALRAVVREANYVEVVDTGDGMSRDDLDRVYLTIGTSHRVGQRAPVRGGTPGQTRAMLGEKGIGRLSAMRLGAVLRVTTGRREDHCWNVLAVDWDVFAAAGDRDLGDIDVAPVEGAPKLPLGTHGTTIRVGGLRAAWSADRIREVAGQTFARLTDPFSASRYPLRVTFNDVEVKSEPFPKAFIDGHAHGYLKVTYDPDAAGGPALTGVVEYRLRGRSRDVDLRGAHLASAAGGAAPDVLKRLGPFVLDAYWFNRRILTKVEGIGTLAQVRRLIEQWSGGVAVYRDGFRVHPYADPGDDWLNLDREAFSTSGFKLNTGQVIGRVAITRDGNPLLIDQTNREGLRDTPEKSAFTTLLASVMDGQYRNFLNQVDKELKAGSTARQTLDEVTQRVAEEEDRLQGSVSELVGRLTHVPEARAFAAVARDAVDSIREMNEEVRRTALAYESGRSQLVHLASVGLMVEVLAHELWRATQSALSTIADARRQNAGASLGPTLAVLDAQLRTLQKRLKVLDPLSTNARQTKETFEVGAWVSSVVAQYAPQLDRRDIAYEVRVEPVGGEWHVRAVRGMVVQVLENLLNNSAYWLEQQRKFQGQFDPFVAVVVDCAARQIRVTDNGPGVPMASAERVFEPYYSTKPPKQGKGLGLFISREIAEYHGGRLYLADTPDAHGALHTFVFELGAHHE